MAGVTRDHLAYRAPLHWQLAPRSFAAFALAIFSVASATVVRYALEGLAAGLAPFVTYFAAILISTLIAGAASGALATVLGAICAAWIILPQADLSLTADIVNLSLYLATALLIVWCAEQFRRACERLQDECRRRDRHLAFIRDQNDVLSQIAAQTPLHDIFTVLVRTIEGYSNFEMLGSILLLDDDGRHLRLGAAPSLPRAYNEAIDGMEIGPAAGSCGTAAHLRQRIIVEDIAKDLLWTGWREIGLAHGLRACWSQPIMSTDSGKVLGTFAIYYRTPRRPASEELDLISFMGRTAALAIECSNQDAQKQLLLRELNHRLKNTLATINSLARQTLRGKVDFQVLSDFEARLMGLARAHDLLLQQHWQSVDLHDLIATCVMQPFGIPDGRIRVDGPRVRLEPRLTPLFAMTLHELCTNAEKYGALAGADGNVLITWTVAPEASDIERLEFYWTESGGPAVEIPTHRGFGTTLIERALRAEANGAASFDYRPEGLVCHISAQVIRRSRAPQERSEPADQLNDSGEYPLAPISSYLQHSASGIAHAPFGPQRS